MPHWFIDRDERHMHAQKYKQVYQMIAGAASGAITKTATAPLERVKILLQLQGMSSALKGLPPSSNILQVLSYMWREEGIRGLFKGNGANVARVIPVYALKFSFNERFRDVVRSPGQRDKHLSFIQLISAGTLAGLTQIVITYPLELIRTRLSLSNNTTLATSAGKYNGMIDCAVKTVRIEGIKGLYKGLQATIWSGAPYVGLQMTTYEMVKRTLPHTQPHIDREGHMVYIVSPLWKLVAGGLSGLISQTITFPGDTVRRRMQTNGLSGMNKVYSNTWDCCVKIYKYEGIPGFFKGAMTNVYRSVPGAALQFGVYDLFKHVVGIAGEG